METTNGGDDLEVVDEEFAQVNIHFSVFKKFKNFPFFGSMKTL
jgi:hypothetical protein